jgi:protein-disulfide isomerase
MSSRLFAPIEERDHVRGALDAPVALLEYGDYDCPICANVHSIVKAIERRLEGRLCFIYRNFPLRQMHPHAEEAAEAAEAAGAQGRFWQMHDFLFENQESLGRSSLTSHAERIGIDVRRWQEALDKHTFAHRVQEDFISGVRSGVTATPTFFVNGMRFEGPVESLLLTVESLSVVHPDRSLSYSRYP